MRNLRGVRVFRKEEEEEEEESVLARPREETDREREREWEMIKVTGTSNVVIHREPGCFLRCLGMMLARAFQALFVLETNGRPVKYLTPFHPSLRPRFQPSSKSV